MSIIDYLINIEIKIFGCSKFSLCFCLFFGVAFFLLLWIHWLGCRGFGSLGAMLDMQD